MRIAVCSTIVNKRSYVCLRNGRCSIASRERRRSTTLRRTPFVDLRPACKYCRWVRCVLGGLSLAPTSSAAATAAAVVTSPSPAVSKLQRLVERRRATFVGRFNARIAVHGGRHVSSGKRSEKHELRVLQDLVNFGHRNPTFAQLRIALHAEFLVLDEYLRAFNADADCTSDDDDVGALGDDDRVRADDDPTIGDRAAAICSLN